MEEGNNLNESVPANIQKNILLVEIRKLNGREIERFRMSDRSHIIIIKFPWVFGNTKQAKEVIDCWNIFFDNNLVDKIVTYANIFIKTISKKIQIIMIVRLQLKGRLEHFSDCYMPWEEQIFKIFCQLMDKELNAFP